jgi:hypothetical protein
VSRCPLKQGRRLPCPSNGLAHSPGHHRVYQPASTPPSKSCHALRRGPFVPWGIHA